MNSQITRRLFLVGCPRSGTTLLQCILASHPMIASVPETHFFWHLVPSRRRWAASLGLASPGASQWYDRFEKILQAEPGTCPRPRIRFLARGWARAFMQTMDTYALRQGKRIWLEKTPEHLHHIDTIERFIPGAKLIHIVRDGADVVASIYDMTHKYPDLWGGVQTLDQCIDRWIQDVQISARYLSRPNHALVVYEDLIARPQATIQTLCDAIDIPFETTMLQAYRETSQSLLPRQSLDTNHPLVGQALQNTHGEKLRKLFDAEQQQYIIERVARIDLNQLFRRWRPVPDHVPIAAHDTPSQEKSDPSAVRKG